ncbi:Addiction module killer protein [Acetobacteraceae bacterium EV16G]|uniref:Addiction module killer protein n=1 Tax=Sorlinia euscelidii TaxID=3081148 RepID=A0ABU7U1U9_9PROT
MREIRQTEAFAEWLHDLKDRKTKQVVSQRILLMAAGSLGDVKSLGDGLFEARIHYGPGYRLYFVQRGRTVIILLCGGSKRNQKRDIKNAQWMIGALENEENA